MEKYLSIYDSDFKLCDEDSRISTDMETKPSFFAKKRAAKSTSVKYSPQTPRKFCEICELFKTPRKIRSEIREPFKTSRKTRRENLRAIQNSAKNSAKIRERKAQDGNNLRRNWFIGGCPISWRRPTLPHSHAVPSARTGLTALFGMGRGVPRGYNRHCLLKFLAYSTHINAL